MIDLVDDEIVGKLDPGGWREVANSRRPKLPQTTEWFAGDVAPLHTGWYERYFLETAENQSETRMHYWDGAHWRRMPVAPRHSEQVGAYPAWRGVSAPQDPAGIFWDRSGSWLSVSGTHADVKSSELFPNPGELWQCAGRVSVICGNGFNEDGRVWIMDWKTGASAYAWPAQLLRRHDRHSLSRLDLLARFGEWARAGNASAIWWLAWWYEGINHFRSIWYYVGALRASPQEYGWAQSRIMYDARCAIMVADLPSPDTSFITAVPELIGMKIGDDWMAAVLNAECAMDIPQVAEKLPRVA